MFVIVNKIGIGGSPNKSHAVGIVPQMPFTTKEVVK